MLGEKPAGVYTKRVREMNEVAAKSDKVFALMFNQRTNPMYIKLREIVQSGEYGGLHRFNWIITDCTARRHIITPADGAPPGAARAAACCSISARISSICGSG